MNQFCATKFGLLLTIRSFFGSQTTISLRARRTQRRRESQVNRLFLREQLDVLLSGLCYSSASLRPQRSPREMLLDVPPCLRASVRSLVVGRSLVPARLDCGTIGCF